MKPLRITVAALGATLALMAMLPMLSASAQAPAANARTSDVERGRYLVRTSGCNDCHTPGYMETAGQVDEAVYLTGSPLGWTGPWGTTYASNLRLVAQSMTEDQWLVHARAQWRPPMPWFAMRDMRDDDVRAIYRYLRHLGPAGAPAPVALPPGQQAPLPHFAFVRPAQ
ncbi:MAG: c-type cytochrome [Burkholderiaceae bacterium]|nr:c-type cytochrome [Burkholderiaceae bacterium]